MKLALCLLLLIAALCFVDCKHRHKGNKHIDPDEYTTTGGATKAIVTDEDVEDEGTFLENEPCENGEKRDCKGVCGGKAFRDCKGVCEGKTYRDCAGVCGGSTYRDCAGVCGGKSYKDCKGECGGKAFKDSEGNCVTQEEIQEKIKTTAKTH